MRHPVNAINNKMSEDSKIQIINLVFVEDQIESNRFKKILDSRVCS